MTTLKRATIKSYSAATHKASVQVAGSLSVWLDNIPVATDIAPAEVVAGRECAVLFFTDDNPDDAVVITIHGAVPAGASAGTSIADADNDTKVQTEKTADEDRIRFDTVAVERLIIDKAAPIFRFAGDLRAGTGFQMYSQDMASGPLTGHRAAFGKSGTGVDGMIALQASLGGSSSVTAGDITGVAGRAVSRDVDTLNAYGLDYIAGVISQDLSVADVVRAQLLISASGKTLTDGRGFHVRSPLLVLGTLSNNTAFEADDIAAGTNRRGFRCGDIAGGTLARYCEFGTAPDFMVKGTGELARAANETPVFIAEGTTPTVRQVKWKAFSALVAADKVMVLV